MQIEYQKDLPDGSAVFTMQDATDVELAALVSKGFLAVVMEAVNRQLAQDKYAQEGWKVTPIVLSAHKAGDDPLDINKAVHVTLSRNAEQGASVQILTRCPKLAEGQAAMVSKAFNQLLGDRVE